MGLQPGSDRTALPGHRPCVVADLHGAREPGGDIRPQRGTTDIQDGEHDAQDADPDTGPRKSSEEAANRPELRDDVRRGTEGPGKAANDRDTDEAERPGPVRS